MGVSGMLRWRLKAALRSLGWGGWLAFAMLVLAALVQWTAVAPAQLTVRTLQAGLRDGHTAVPAALSAGATEARRLAAFFGQLPDDGSSVAAMEKLLAAARANNVELDRGDYHQSHVKGEPVSRLELTLPVKGDYRAIRHFLAQALSDLPSMALDSVVFSRNRIDDPLVEAQIKLTLYMNLP